MELEKGKQYKVKEIKNVLINTEVNNIVEVISSNDKSTEFRDIKTFDWFVIDNNNINECLIEVN